MDHPISSFWKTTLQLGCVTTSCPGLKNLHKSAAGYRTMSIVKYVLSPSPLRTVMQAVLAEDRLLATDARFALVASSGAGVATKL